MGRGSLAKPIGRMVANTGDPFTDDLLGKEYKFTFEIHGPKVVKRIYCSGKKVKVKNGIYPLMK